MKMKNIAVYGGAFDPPHQSHIKIIRALQKSDCIDQVWLLPCGDRTDKRLLLSKIARFDLLNRIFAKDQKVHVSDFEIEMSIQQKRMIETFELMGLLRQKYPESKFHMVVGADILHTIDSWGMSKQLKEQVDFIVFNRKGYEIEKEQLPKKYRLCEQELDNISSSYLKAVLWDQNKTADQKLKSVSEHLPPEALEILKKQKIL